MGRSVKLLIIDEVYTLSVEWLSIIDERIPHLFNPKQIFGGLPLLIVGDPRQIVPVKGKPIYAISKYFSITESWLGHTNLGLSHLIIREEKGFRLYAASKYHAPLSQSVRLRHSRFASLNMKIAQYKLLESDLPEVQSLVRSKTELYTSPWIDAPWLLPTWAEVNRHIQTVTNYRGRHKGIFRAWSKVSVPGITSMDEAKNAVKAFYKHTHMVRADFNTPLPYIDLFFGQISALKQNWNPTWNLYNNAKAFVVGIVCKDPRRQNQPHMSLSEAIEAALYEPDMLTCTFLVKPFIPFTGPSAHPNVPGIIAVPWVEVKKTYTRLQNCN